MRLVPRLLLGVALLFTPACTYRPARYADRPVVLEIRDDAPIALPSRNNFDEVVHVSDVYLRRPLFDVFSPVRFPEAGDVNALDDVPTSSWFRVPTTVAEATNESPVAGSPPEPPFLITGEAPKLSKLGLVVVDARGLRYELRIDGKERPEMSTGAAAVASRLVRAFGLQSPGVWIRSVSRLDIHAPPDPANGIEEITPILKFLADSPPAIDDRYRVSATRWPIGVDLGSTPDFDARGGDRNDLVAHRDRRTLRAFKVLGAWLGLAPFGPRKTRDSYKGAAGEGHVVHYVVGLEDSLGASSIVTQEASRTSRRSRLAGAFFFNLATLGFYPASFIPPTQEEHLALGNVTEEVNPAKYDPSPAYGPVVRASEADNYWASKRLMAIPRATIEAAVDSAGYTDLWVRNELVRLLESRRRTLATYWYGQVSPIEVVAVENSVVRLRDQGVEDGLVSFERMRYRVRIVDDDGRSVAGPWTVPLASSELSVPLPPSIVGTHRYLVIRLTAERDGTFAPLTCDVHVAIDEDGVARRVIGLQHGEGR